LQGLFPVFGPSPFAYAEIMREIDIIGLHHIQLAMPAGQESIARDFYVGVLGMTEIAKPDQLQGRGGVWFARGSVALHLGIEAPFVPARKAHPAFEVSDLASAHAALKDHRLTDISSLPGLRRFYILDPFGNRIEILQTH